MGRLAYRPMSARGRKVTDETLANRALRMLSPYDAQSDGVGATFTLVTRSPGTEADP
jgi:hypothetical protein